MQTLISIVFFLSLTFGFCACYERVFYLFIFYLFTFQVVYVDAALSFFSHMKSDMIHVAMSCPQLFGNIWLSMASLVIFMQLRYLFHEVQRRIRRHKNYLRVIDNMESRLEGHFLVLWFQFGKALPKILSVK